MEQLAAQTAQMSRSVRESHPVAEAVRQNRRNEVARAQKQERRVRTEHTGVQSLHSAAWCGTEHSPCVEDTGAGQMTRLNLRAAVQRHCDDTSTDISKRSMPLMARRLCAEPDRERRGSTAAHLGTSEVRREGQCNTKRNAMRVLGLLPETQRLALRASCLGLCREYAPERDGRARHLTAHCAAISRRTMQRTCAGVASVRSHAISRPTEECDSQSIA